MRELSKVALFTKEYPPHVYGGAGVHVEYLSAALAKLVAVEVRCFGDQRSAEGGNPAVRGYPRWDEAARNTDPRFVGAVDAFARSLAMAKDRHCQLGGLQGAFDHAAALRRHHAATWAHVSCRQTRKALARARRYWAAVIRCRRGRKWP